MRRVFEEREGREIAFDSENCRDRRRTWGKETQTVQEYENFYEPEDYPCIDVPWCKGEKDGECRKREWRIAENECMGG